MAGKFTDVVSDAHGSHPHGSVRVDSVSTHAPVDAVIVPDAHLLFTGDFKRSGVDLVLTSGDRELVLPDYFRGEKRAALASPDGAHLTGDIVNALAGHIQLAQADGSASVAPALIGHVTKLTGSATAIRNGVSIILNQGDTVHKGDVVQSGSDSTLGITFIDGTVFGLASNAKMVLNEMIYDPNGSDNKSLLSLVQGTISFVAGATAKKGDMKVDTPVATMGIRGTAVLVEIDFEVPSQGGAPPAKFQVLVEPDGTTGSYILFDKTTLTPIATVNRAGTQTIINGQGSVTFQSSVQLSPDAQKVISDVFSLKFTDLNNPNTKLTTNFTDSIVPQTSFLKLASNDFVPVTLQFVNVPDKPAPSPGTGPSPHLDHIPGPPAAAAHGGSFTERVDITASAAVDSVSGIVSYADINPGDVPSVSTAFSSFIYANAQKADVTATLTAEQLAAIKAVEVPLVVVQDPNGKNTGQATWTYNIADGAFDFLASGETLTLTYMARVDNNYAPSNETTFVPFTIVITGTNDKPTLSATGGTITERIGTGNTAVDTVTGTVTFADSDLTDRPVVSAAISATDPFRYYDAEGNDVTATLTPAQLAAILAVEVPLSVVQAAGNTHNGSATWTYSIEDSKFDFIAKGERLTLNYVAQVDDGHGGVISTPITVSIHGADVVVTGTNDLPTIVATSAAFAEFSSASQPNPTGSNALHVAAGTISFTDVDLTDRPVASTAFTAFTYLNASSIDVTSQLTAKQLAAIAAVDEPLTMVQNSGNTNNGSASWSYSVADSAFDFLADGEILNLTYTATVNDGHGGVVTKPITITVTGSNDTAQIISDLQAATISEVADTHGSTTPDTASGMIKFIDADLTDTHAVKIASVHASGVTTGLANGAVQLSWLSLSPLADSTDGKTGSKSWSFSAPDSYFDYLADGETVTLTYTVEVDDHHGGVTSQDVIVTVNGSNDAPEIADIAKQGISEQTDTAPLTTTISVTFTDRDLSDVGHTAAITGAAASGTTTGLALDEAALIALVTRGTVTKAAGSSSGSVDLSFSAASTAFDYLAKGEVLTLTYTVSIDDGDGGVTPKTFVVTVTGTDDAPVIGNIAQKDLTEQTDTAPLTATIPVTFTDVDLTDVGHAAAITGVTLDGDTDGLGLNASELIALVSAGTVTKASGSSAGSVNLGFSAASTAFDYLAEAESVTLTYTVAINDGDSGITSQTFTITVTGTNDAPVLTASAPSLITITEDQTANAGQTVASFLGASIADVDHGALQGIAITATTSAHGHWEYSTDGSTFVAFPAVSGGSALLLAATDKVRFVPDGEDGGTDTFTYVAWDQTTGIHGTMADASAAGGSTAFSVTSNVATLTVTAVNDAPTAAAPATHYVATEQAPLVISGTGLHVADIDGNGGTETVTLSVGEGILDVDLGGNDVSVTGNGTSSVTITGLVDYIEALLSGDNSGTISYSANSDNPSASTGLTLSVNDAGNSGSNGSQTATATVTIDITPINDAPVATDDVASITGNTGSITGHLLANDTDAEHDTLSVSNVVNGVAASGHITVDGTYGRVVIDQATGDYTYTLGATSAQAAAVAALDHGVTVQDDFTYTASDGALGSDGHLKVNVTGVDEALVLSAESIRVEENGDAAVTTTVFDIILSDDDQASDVTITARALHGELSLVDDDNVGVLEIHGTVSAINDKFASGIIYTPADNSENDIVTVTATDAQGQSDTLNFMFQQSGSDGATLAGTGEKDVIFATGGEDTLSGGAKADQFVFAPEYSPSEDEITDFKVGEDHIDLRAFSEVHSDNIDAWLDSHKSETGANGADTLITLDTHDTITIKGVTAANLHASDFIVSPHH
ncbi:VCBS repeat-containing protein [Bradyrhizobium sp. AZCC 1678]